MDAGEDLSPDLAAAPIGEELWVIAREPAATTAPADDTPGCGTLKAKRPDQETDVPLPLEHTDVQAQISGYIATVGVTQRYHNPYDEKIEAVYVFPLPQNAAVNEFIMTIGDRRIRGIIREREEAEKIYAEARSMGHVASLLTQERPNIFTQAVANIEPGKRIDIDIRYFHTLAYSRGAYEFVFPMVVGPRFNPPGSTDGVGAVARGSQGGSGQKTDVHYLRPNERSGHDIAVSVDINAGVTIEDITSPSHAITRTTHSPEHASVALNPLDRIPNKDFVLRYKVAGDKVKSAILTHRDERGGFFTMMLFPPAGLESTPRRPMEMIFVLDCSGSMSGEPIRIAKSAVRRALRRMEARDTFQIIRFSNDASALGPAPIPATPRNVERGLQYLDSLEGSGGTMMIEGIKAALDFAHDPQRTRVVSFLTDGFIGNDAAILGEVHKRLGASRIFGFGSSTNRYLLTRMAQIGRGAVAFVGIDESAAAAVDGFYECVSHAAMTDIEIDFGGLDVTDVYPRRIPDLFVGRPVVLTGRFKGAGNAMIRVAGTAGDGRQDITLHANTDDAAATHKGLPSVWARMRIADLADQATYDTNADLPGEIKQVALEYGLMSAFTAFVAVDSQSKTAGDYGTTVSVSVPVPEGVRYETAVSE